MKILETVAFGYFKNSFKKRRLWKKIYSLQIWKKKAFKFKTIDVEMFSTIASFLSLLFSQRGGGRKTTWMKFQVTGADIPLYMFLLLLTAVCTSCDCSTPKHVKRVILMMKRAQKRSAVFLFHVASAVLLLCQWASLCGGYAHAFSIWDLWHGLVSVWLVSTENIYPYYLKQ